MGKKFITIPLLSLLFFMCPQNQQLPHSESQIVLTKKTVMDPQSYIQNQAYYFYNSNGTLRLVHTIYYYSYAITHEYAYYLYNDNNLNTQITINDISDDTLRYYINFFDENGNIIKEEKYYPPQSLDSYRLFTYDTDKITLSKRYTINSSRDAIYVSYYENVYDENNVLDRRNHYLFDEEANEYLWLYDRFAYTEDGYLLLKIQYLYNDNTDDILLGSTFYEYGLLQSNLYSLSDSTNDSE